MKPGIYKNLTLQQYHADSESYSKSNISDFNDSPLLCWYNKTNKQIKRRDHFEIGTAVHAAILEGYDVYSERLSIVPNEVLGKGGDRNTSDYKKWLAEQPDDKTILMKDQADNIEKIIRSVFKKSVFKKYLSSGFAEMSFFWNETFIGFPLQLKVRPDFIPYEQIVVDLKTTADIRRFSKVAGDLKYHWSAFLTCRGMIHLTGKHHREYYFAVIETSPPYDSAMFRVMPEHFERAEQQVMELLPQLAECHNTVVWPGKPDEILPLNMRYY